MKRRNIFLIGPMGTGKTTIGRQVARSLGLTFYDSDREIESRTGVEIPVIFEYEGEDGFRKREQAMINELTQLRGIVLATGGGAILRPESCASLRRYGFVVYLKCSIDCLLVRTQKDTHRPLLNTANRRERLELLMEIREPLYRSCADCTIDTGQLSSRNAVKAIVSAFQSYRQSEGRSS